MGWAGVSLNALGRNDQDFEYDGSSMIGWNTGSALLQLPDPSGWRGSGGIVHLGRNHYDLGAADRCIRLDPRAGECGDVRRPVTTYTYDPSGTPSVTERRTNGRSSIRAEKEFTDPQPYYYSGSGSSTVRNSRAR